MLRKLATAAWYARRPTHWAHAAELAKRKLRTDFDTPEQRSRSTGWAAERAVPIAQALAAIGLEGDPPVLDPALLDEGHERAMRAGVQMGGPGDVNLLFAAARMSGAARLVETGVAFGWSSLALLAAIEDRDGARLVSIDMPYPREGKEAFVGAVVPERLRERWTILREPDRHGLEKAIALLGTMDLAHYDSDKSWWGRRYAYPLIWSALAPGGVFISDDIQDNLAFREFVEEKRTPFAVTSFEGKYVGITRKH
jgi:predicted O-methyltransferase YrrM